MTCREKLKIEHPDKIDAGCGGGCSGCPGSYGYLPDPEYCAVDADSCDRCWDREIPETDKPRILDSGERRNFPSGAVRDIQEGKGRCDLMPLDVVGSFLNNPTLSYICKFQESGDVSYLRDALSSSGVFHDPYTMFLEVAKHFEEGAKKYSEDNWRKGINAKNYVDSGVRHYLKWLRGDKDEPHDRAFVWNILCCIWTCIHKPELNDYGKSV